MTAIAYRNGVLAADTLATAGGMKVGHLTKIRKRADGALAAAAGMSWHCNAFPESFCQGDLQNWRLPGDDDKEDAEARACFGAMVIDPDGSVWDYDRRGGDPAPKNAWYSQGSAFVFLMGAMAAGATAAEAVALAIEHCADCGGTVETLRLGKD